jgi:hypothetical protein
MPIRGSALNNDNQSPRATRFTISMPLRYREPGEAAWHGGRVENISRTGVLFTVEKVMDVSARVEMSFELPVELSGARPGQVFCVGKVVRTVMPASTDRPPAMAASIQSYEFSPADRR